MLMRAAHISRKWHHYFASVGGGGWSSVTAPDTSFSWLPTTIQSDGTNYRIDPDFVLRDYADVSVTTTYYVKPASEGGNDLANGLSEATAFASINRALSRSDVDRVMVKAGLYGITTYPSTHHWNNQTPARNIEVIGYGGQVISSTQIEPASLSWSAVDNHYETSYATNIAGGVWDSATLDGEEHTAYTKKTSIAEVDVAPGSWWYDATADVIYVRTLDDRSPDSDIRCYVSVPNGRINDSVTYYVEGIDFYGGANAFLGPSAEVATNAYFKDCEFKYALEDMVAFTGGGEVVLQDCVAARGGADNIHLEQSGSFSASLLLINVISRKSGEAGDTNANAYSRHGPGSTVAINCEFSHTYGPNMYDINADTFTWMLGTYAHNMMTNSFCFGISGAGSKMWLDGVISEDAQLADIHADEGATLYYRSMTPSVPSTDGSGTFDTY